ncbi:aspartate 1-decarboxylase [Eggerthellaceae bacterium 3-80]|nr:aspartate 1-decarboxylase [bacterium D16-34]
MRLTMLKGKIHRATVTQAEIDYIGSITLDASLARAAHIREYERVLVADADNGERLETYVIYGEENSGMVCLNGAAAYNICPGHKVIIMAFAEMDVEEVADQNNAPYVVFVDEKNAITSLKRYEKHGRLEDLK